MDIDHVHFYVKDAKRSRDWFVNLGFQPIASGQSKSTRTEIVNSGSVYFVLSSPLTDSGPVAEYLQTHPSGVTDLAFRVGDVQAIVTQAVNAQAKILQPVQAETRAQGSLKWGKILGWGALGHTLLERCGTTPLLPLATEWGVDSPLVCESSQAQPDAGIPANTPIGFSGIDHVVLNVAAGDLSQAADWYEAVLRFQPSRSFEIQTTRSALRSKVMVHPDGSAQLPLNEPASPGSQIQEFLDLNCGSGIQHVALHTTDIIRAIANLRQRGLSFLNVPASYYRQLQQRCHALPQKLNWQVLQTHQVLLDWQDQSPQAILLQTFTQPVFEQPTFFFELIQRYSQAQGFGEGNFLALFEAIEREQIKRGSLA